MKFREISKAVVDSIVGFTQEQLEARKRRLSNPSLQIKLENTKELFKDDLKNACTESLSALWKFTLGAPLIATYEGFVGVPLSVLSHNLSEKNKKKKKEYPNVVATTITELLTQYGKGTMNIIKVAGHLSLALGRGTVLASRYTIGK